MSKRFVCSFPECSQLIIVIKHECDRYRIVTSFPSLHTLVVIEFHLSQLLFFSCGRVYCAQHGPQSLFSTSSLNSKSSTRNVVLCIDCCQKLEKKQFPGKSSTYNNNVLDLTPILSSLRFISLLCFLFGRNHETKN
jgi:hypothetical protein